jgi:hypothetical protein
MAVVVASLGELSLAVLWWTIVVWLLISLADPVSVSVVADAMNESYKSAHRLASCCPARSVTGIRSPSTRRVMV